MRFEVVLIIKNSMYKNDFNSQKRVIEIGNLNRVPLIECIQSKAYLDFWLFALLFTCFTGVSLKLFTLLYIDWVIRNSKTHSRGYKGTEFVLSQFSDCLILISRFCVPHPWWKVVKLSWIRSIDRSLNCGIRKHLRLT